jgi:hypothetical protein
MLDCEARDEMRPPSAVPRFKQLVPRKLLSWVVPIWITCLTIGSLLPGDLKVELGTTTKQQQVHPNKDVILPHRLAHFALFGFTACLLMLLARTNQGEIVSVLLAILLGSVIEFAQHAVYRFTFEWWDVRDDAIGAIGAYVLFRVLHHMSGVDGTQQTTRR